MVLYAYRLFLLVSFSCLGLLNGYAQPLENSVQKINSYENITYTDIVRTKFHFQDDFSADTFNTHLVLLTKEPVEGGYYQVKGSDHSYAFDGNKLVNLNLTDSTYIVGSSSDGGQNTRTLLYWARYMDKLLKLPKTQIRQLQDTVINNSLCSNLQVIEKDTIVNKEHQYIATGFFINQASHLPTYIHRLMKGNADDGSYFEFIETHNYSDYGFDRKDFPDLSLATIPAHFRTAPTRVPVEFLPVGTVAPSMKAFDLSGKPFKLEKLKERLVLINFSLIGCPHCVGAAQMLNRLDNKYKDRGLVIVNIYPIDQKEAIIKFDNRQNVKTPSFTSERAVQQAYPFDGYPSFYLLDKKGLVAQTYNGFYKELESLLTEKIELLGN